MMRHAYHGKCIQLWVYDESWFVGNARSTFEKIICNNLDIIYLLAFWWFCCTWSQWMEIVPVPTCYILHTHNYLPPRRRPGDGRYCNAPRPSVCLSVCPSCLVSHCNSKTHGCIFFLETLQVRTPCHGGVLYSFWYWWNVVWIFYEFFKYWKK